MQITWQQVARDFFTDPPPMKWSGLRYVSDVKKDSNAKEAIQAEEIVAKAVATRNPLSYSSLLTLVKNGSTAAPAFPARQSARRSASRSRVRSVPFERSLFHIEINPIVNMATLALVLQICRGRR